MKRLILILIVSFSLSMFISCASNDSEDSGSENAAEDTSSPTNSTVLINNGDASTDRRIVILSLSAKDNIGVTGYYVSEVSSDLSADATGWTDVSSDASYSAEVFFTLSDSTGDKTVYAWFKDAGGNVSDSTSDTIELPVFLLLPDSGQTVDYASTYGEDSDYTINSPSFTDNSDDTITDNNTLLIWQKNDDNTRRTWDNAVSYCQSLPLAGYSDWRLPNPKELQSIVNFGQTSPAIDTTYFPGTDFSYDWWSTTSVYSSSYAWSMIFDSGTLRYNNKSSFSFYVRCVRGGNESDIWSLDFLDIGDGTVLHKSTGLTWQREDDNIPKNWEEALSYCEGLPLGGYNDWRLPNIRELQSIVDYSTISPAIDTTYFSGTDSSSYWSSTTSVSDTSRAWYVFFGQGTESNSNKTNSYYVRCVRGGQ